MATATLVRNYMGGTCLHTACYHNACFDVIKLLVEFNPDIVQARTHENIHVVKGKAGYIAPEVILGRDVDGRAGVFSMGVLLWNALTGETLFDRGDLASSLTSLLRSEIPPPSSVGLQPSPLFDAPILTALARDVALYTELLLSPVVRLFPLKNRRGVFRPPASGELTLPFAVDEPGDAQSSFGRGSALAATLFRPTERAAIRADAPILAALWFAVLELHCSSCL